MAKGDRITASRFNSIRNIAVRVLGLGSGNEGYGQTTVSTVVSPGQVINSTIFNNLRTDLVRCYTHQTNAAVSNTPANETVPSTLLPPNLEIATGSTQVSNEILVQYENFANNILTNRLVANAGQLTSVPLTTTQRSTLWGSTVDVISHTITLTFGGYTPSGGSAVSPEDHMRVFFNAGGKVRINASLAGGTATAKYNDWVGIFNRVGTLTFDASGVSVSGGTFTGTLQSTLGFFSGLLPIGGLAQQIMFQGGTQSQYAENDYTITVQKLSNGGLNNQLAFVLTFRDDDAGDQTGLGGPQDENVGGTLTTTCTVDRPFGAQVDVPAPSGSATAL